VQVCKYANGEGKHFYQLGKLWYPDQYTRID
jgi:hypothetical protein